MADPAPLMSQIADAPAGGRAVWLDANGVRIRAAIWSGGERGTALIFTGRTEYIEKYGRVAAALVKRGYAVVTLDWRGQGLSERALAEPMKGHVGDFAEFQHDVAAVLRLIEDEDLPAPLTLFCHSMGGCIGARALADDRITPVATVMSAPMLSIRMRPHEMGLAPVLIGASRIFGLDDRFTPSPQPTVPYVEKTSFAKNVLTTDAEYYDWMRQHLVAEPKLGLGPPTIGWLARAIEETKALARASVYPGPVLAILGGAEEVVAPSAIRDYAKRQPACELLEVPGAKHEIFMECAAMQDLAWRRIDAFLDQHS